MYDALIIGGGVSGMQCALILGSGLTKPYAENKKVGIILHQRASHLTNALFNNVLGLKPGTKGSDILNDGADQLKALYPEVTIKEKEKVIEIFEKNGLYTVATNKNSYQSKIVVIALNYAKPFTINGLEEYEQPHQKANPEKNRIELKNKDHLIKKGLYVCGTLAGHRSQFAIAAGSGAAVATDILTQWNGGNHTKVHDES